MWHAIAEFSNKCETHFSMFKLKSTDTVINHDERNSQMREYAEDVWLQLMEIERFSQDFASCSGVLGGNRESLLEINKNKNKRIDIDLLLPWLNAQSPWSVWDGRKIETEKSMKWTFTVKSIVSPGCCVVARFPCELCSISARVHAGDFKYCLDDAYFNL